MSSVAPLFWKSLPYDRAHFFTKGTELAMAYVPGTLSRFAVYETRGGKDDEGHSMLVYRLRDAATVSDEGLRLGKRPDVIAVFDEPDKAVAEALRIAGA